VTDEYQTARQKMVDQQLRPRGITDKGVLEAMEKIPRHRFVPEKSRFEAYQDYPLPIGHNQTISQPYIVALMTQALQLTGTEKTLEIGLGSGYQTSILAELSHTVYSVDRIHILVDAAEMLLKELGYKNVFCKAFDGTLGWPEEAPFDAIMVTAAGPKVPKPLINQLSDGGRLVIPVGSRSDQDLIRLTKREGRVDRENLGGCRFVDLIGVHGWPN
jgi:protein-L-isoaspartate(D-aspartate) O-methyltransferase